MGVRLKLQRYTHNMKFLVLSAPCAVSSCQLVTYPNGAVVPAVPYPYAAPLGAVGPLVAYTNGAVVPADTPAVAQAKADFAAAGGVIANQAVYPGFWPYGGLVAHPNGAAVPAVPADVVAARAAALRALAEA